MNFAYAFTSIGEISDHIQQLASPIHLVKTSQDRQETRMQIPSSKRRRLACALAFASLGLSLMPFAANAESRFPNKPVRIIVPFPAGQGADAAARALARELQGVLGQPVIVDNRPGGNNVIGAKAVITAPADGYTLFYGTNSPMAANAVFYRSLGYDPIKDFTPIALLGRAPWVMVVSEASPIRSYEDLVRTSKENPKSVSIGVGATGYQLAAILLTNSSGMPATIVPYKGTPQAITDVVGQQVTATLADFGTMRPLIETGRVRPLLAFDTRRIEALPNIPSLQDLKLDVPTLSSWTGLFARAGTSATVVAQLTEATRKALDSAEYRKFVSQNGSQVTFAKPDALAKLQTTEVAHYREAMKVGHVEPQ